MKKSPFSLKCLSIFTFLFLGMNNPQAFMSRVSYFCPDVTHSLCLHHFFSAALLQKHKWQLSLSLLTSQPFSRELGHESSLVLKILDFQVFDTFYLCTHQSTSSLISLNCLFYPSLSELGINRVSLHPLSLLTPTLSLRMARSHLPRSISVPVSPESPFLGRKE